MEGAGVSMVGRTPPCAPAGHNDRMLGRVSKLRHAVVGLAIGASSALAGCGVIGAGDHPERFDAKTVVVEPQPSGSIRVTEYVDQDFGNERRRGYQRVVPNDFGVPTDVVTSSPDAPDDLDVLDQGDTTRIRVGDPDVTNTGQHRYVLSYTYPAARLDELGLALDIVAPAGAGWPGDAETGRFEVVVVGVELADVRCDTGPLESTGGCELISDEIDGLPVYRTVVEPLPAEHGLSLFADIVGFAGAAEVDAPPIPERRESRRSALALLLLPAGLAGAVPVYRWARHQGRNEVFAGGAADAAFGSLPAPGRGVSPPPPVRFVPDDELADLVTIEFVPPSGIEPWEASVLVRERIDDTTVEAWFSGLAGHEAIELSEAGEHLSIGSGSRRSSLEPDDAELVDSFLRLGDPYTTGAYDSSFATAWKNVSKHQKATIAGSGWWKHLPPGSGLDLRLNHWFGAVVLMLFLFVWTGAAIGAFIGLIRSWPAAIAFGVVLPAIVALFVYRTLLPARSAHGSALALRAESFRRFLAASEGHHVEWAWENGLLREYSAWAVALGEADAWSDALARANVPAPAIAAAGPVLIDRMGPSVRSSKTAPSSSGSGSGGGFSGGGSGGGGGGGSSGSW